jgi:hypothetical protein
MSSVYDLNTMAPEIEDYEKTIINKSAYFKHILTHMPLLQI